MLVLSLFLFMQSSNQAQETMLLMFRVGLPTSVNLIKTIPHWQHPHHPAWTFQMVAGSGSSFYVNGFLNI